MNVLTLAQLTQKAREAWPEHIDFNAATYFTWPGATIYLFPLVGPKLSPDGATTPQQLLEALCAKGMIAAGAWCIIVSEEDLL